MCDRRPATLAICPGRGSRRCLIPASGYFEWATIAMPDKPKPLKQPFYITRRDGLPLTLPGFGSGGKRACSQPFYRQHSNILWQHPTRALRTATR
ncbi:MAG: SOS response-associated peptidase family protein [Rhodomicrobium sp.]